MPKGIVRFIFRSILTLLILAVVTVSAGVGYYYLVNTLPNETYMLSKSSSWAKLNARMLTFESENDFDKVESSLYRMLQDKKYTSSAVPYYLLASLFEAKGQYKEAKATYKAMIQVANLDPVASIRYQRYVDDANASMALLDYKEGKLSAAEGSLNKIANLNELKNPGLWIALKDVLSEPKRADFRFELGKAFRERLELPEARHEFELALGSSYDPELKLDVTNVMLAKMPAKTQALPALARYQALRASDLETQAEVLTKPEEKKHLWDNAIHLYKAMLTESPDFEWGYQQLAHLYIQKEQYGLARHYAELAVAYNPNLYLSRLSLGDIALAEGNYTEAHVQFLQAQQTLSKLGDRYHQTLLVNVENQLGFTQELLQNSQMALAHYHSALSIADQLEEADPSDLNYAKEGIKRVETQAQLIAANYESKI